MDGAMLVLKVFSWWIVVIFLLLPADLNQQCWGDEGGECGHKRDTDIHRFCQWQLLIVHEKRGETNMRKHINQGEQIMDKQRETKMKNHIDQG